MNNPVTVETNVKQITESFTITVNPDVAVALKKMIGRTSINGRVRDMGLSDGESGLISSLHNELATNRDIREFINGCK